MLRSVTLRFDRVLFVRSFELKTRSSATRYVSQNLVNCRNELYDKSTANRMELEGYS